MQLSRQKFGWIKKGPNAALDSDTDSESAMGGQPEPGFISPYEEMIRVFLVDTEMSTIECKVEFSERLPFQAARCSLDGRGGAFTIQIERCRV